MSEFTINSYALSRLNKEMQEVLADSRVFFDVHAHVFNFRDVPDGFLGVRIPLSRRFLSRTENILHSVIRNSDTDYFSNLAYFIRMFRAANWESTAQKLLSYYTGKQAIICVLMMDMQRGVMGLVNDDYNDQLEKMTALRNNLPQTVLPFMAADPFNPQLPGQFRKYFDEEGPYRFFGIKIYPSLGYLPSHPRLMELYAECEKRRIPVTAHCSGASVKTSERMVKKIEGMHFMPGFGFDDQPVDMKFSNEREFAEFFNHPRNWQPVLESFPHLKLNLAHFGGDYQWNRYRKEDPESWVNTIVALMHQYGQVYSDFSYTLYDPYNSEAFRKLLEKDETVSQRVLFGSDYYMILREGKYRQLFDRFSQIMGEERMRQISESNPRQFLFS